MEDNSSTEDSNGSIYAEANDEKCYICQCNEAYNDNPLIFCDGCDLIVHQYCYGILVIPKDEWFCELCEAKSLGFREIKCYLCKSSEGNMKKVNSHIWCHIQCVNLCKYVQITDIRRVYDMKIINQKELDKSRTKTCSICHEMTDSITIQCQVVSCKKHYHPMCLLSLDSFDINTFSIDDFCCPNHNINKIKNSNKRKRNNNDNNNMEEEEEEEEENDEDNEVINYPSRLYSNRQYIASLSDETSCDNDFWLFTNDYFKDYDPNQLYNSITKDFAQIKKENYIPKIEFSLSFNFPNYQNKLPLTIKPTYSSGYLYLHHHVNKDNEIYSSKSEHISDCSDWYDLLFMIVNLPTQTPFILYCGLFEQILNILQKNRIYSFNNIEIYKKIKEFYDKLIENKSILPFYKDITHFLYSLTFIDFSVNESYSATSDYTIHSIKANKTNHSNKEDGISPIEYELKLLQNHLHYISNMNYSRLQLVIKRHKLYQTHLYLISSLLRQAKIGKNIPSSVMLLKPINKTLSNRLNSSVKLKESIENGLFYKSKKKELQKRKNSVLSRYESKLESVIVLNYILNEAFNRINIRENTKSVKPIKNLFISKCCCISCRRSCEIDEYVSSGLYVEAKGSEAGGKNAEQKIEIPAVPEEEIYAKEMKEDEVMDDSENVNTMSNKEHTIPENVVGFIQNNYPQLQGHITGEQYPPPRYAVILSQIVGLFQISMLVCCFTGFGFLASFGLPANVVQWMDDNKATFVLFPFVLNMIVGSLADTGAFEIYVNGVLEFSKLEKGRFPIRNELVKIFKKYGL